MSFLIPHYYRRRFNPEITLEDITNAKLHLEPIRNQLRDVDNTLRAIISRVSRTYNIPIPGGAMGLSTMTSPTSPTGDITRDSARLLLLYLRAVLSKGYFREVDRTWEKVDKFEKSYWDEDEGEQTNTGFWKRLELGDEVLEEGVSHVKKWRDGKAREKEWWPKIKELEDAIREGKRWEQDVGLRRSSISSAASSTTSYSQQSTPIGSHFSIASSASSVGSYVPGHEGRGSMRMSMAGFKPFALGAAAGRERQSIASFGSGGGEDLGRTKLGGLPGSRAGSVSGASETAESLNEEQQNDGSSTVGAGEVRENRENRASKAGSLGRMSAIPVGGDAERIRERWRRRQQLTSQGMGPGGGQPGEYLSSHMASANVNLGTSPTTPRRLELRAGAAVGEEE